MNSNTTRSRSHSLMGTVGGKIVLTALTAFLGVLISASTVVAQNESAPLFSYAQLVEMARTLSTATFKEPKPPVPKALMDLNYDQWRQIRFLPEKSLWREEGLPFELQFFHLGLYYNRPVKINMIDDTGRATPVNFSSDFFRYGDNTFKEPLPPDLGWAGFRIHFPIKSADYKDEVAVFLGASYFRGIGKNHHYGLSARGLALDVATQKGEEFPFFREFWVMKPAMDSTRIVVYALMDSPSVTGAYQFEIIPGEETVMEVDSVLFPRNKIEKLGIAPSTSMFFYGEAKRHANADFRPEVHDSDGLQVAHRSGEWLWRPLAMSPKLQINSFMVGDNNLAGFGLIQRDLNFDHYQDLEARYEMRPSLWVAPKGNWGPGRVELVEIPTDKEIYDNMVAYWVPNAKPQKGKPLSFGYTLYWHADGKHNPPGGRVVATRMADIPGKKGAVKIVLDFEGGELANINDPEKLAAVISASPEAKLDKYQLIKNVVTNGWRLVFRIDPAESIWNTVAGESGDVIELRAFLKSDTGVLTETWSFGVKR